MQQQMNFWETPAPADAAPVLAALDDQQRAEVVATLARAIAKTAAAQNAPPAVSGEEQGDD